MFKKAKLEGLHEAELVQRFEACKVELHNKMKAVTAKPIRVNKKA